MNKQEIKKEAKRVLQAIFIGSYIEEVFDDISDIGKRIEELSVPKCYTYGRYTSNDDTKLREALAKKCLKTLKKEHSYEKTALLIHVLELLYPSVTVDRILEKEGCNSTKVTITRTYMPVFEEYYDDFNKALVAIALLDKK